MNFVIEMTCKWSNTASHYINDRMWDVILFDIRTIFQKYEEAQIHSYYRKIHIARTALFAYSGMLCNRYPAIQVCKNVQTGKLKPNGQINHRFYGRV